MLRNLFKVVLVVVVCVSVIGFVRGWFFLSNPSPNAGSHQININLTVDKDKVQKDAEALRKKTSELTGKAQDEAKQIEDQVRSNDRVRNK